MTAERLVAGTQLDVSCDRFDASGAGVAPVAEGSKTRFLAVAGLFPGEQGRVHVEQVSRQSQRGVARLLSLAHESPSRRQAPCSRHASGDGRCTGCPLMQLDPVGQRASKALDLRSRFGLEIDDFVFGDELGYRRSSKRVAGGRPGAITFGSYVRGSHRIADMAGCLVDDPRIVECVDELKDACNREGIIPFDEPAHAGDLRYVWLKAVGDQVLLTLVSAGIPSRAAAVLPAHLTRPTTIAWSVQEAATNAIRGTPPRILRGPPTVEIELGDERIAVGPLGFLQPNPDVASRAYVDLCSTPSGEPLTGGLALDLYAGAGAVTRRLRRTFQQVRPCESYPESAAALGVEPIAADEFVRRVVSEGVDADLVVANPPRAGMGDDVCLGLLALGPNRLSVMSCHPTSLVHDLAVLRDAYDVECVRAYDTLPQTAHLELVVWLRRRPNPRPIQP